jgi:hypothetical protein
LRSGADAVVAREVVEEALNLGDAHLIGVSLVVIEDEALDPVAVGALGAGAVVAEPEGAPDEVEQLGRRRRRRW